MGWQQKAEANLGVVLFGQVISYGRVHLHQICHKNEVLYVFVCSWQLVELRAAAQRFNCSIIMMLIILMRSVERRQTAALRSLSTTAILCHLIFQPAFSLFSISFIVIDPFLSCVVRRALRFRANGQRFS